MSAPAATTHTATTNAEAAVDDPAYVFHSWSAQALIDPLPIAGGEGAWFWDHEGNRYLDGSSQLVNLNLGHQHPAIVEAIKAQADRLCTVAPTFASDVRGQAARMIVERAGAGFSKVFFTNGGAEATENAVRMAKVHTGRHKVLAHYRSYHGATHGSIALTGDPRRWPSEPSLPGVVHFHGPYPYRSSFGATTPEEETERALAHLDEVLMYEGAHTVAAVIVESVVGTNGILVPPPGYLAGLAERCRAHGILLICDEVMAGFGRCGEWFACQRFDVQPDLICFAKGVNSGYVPLGGVVISEAVAATFAERAYPGGLTYSGHPLACASRGGVDAGVRGRGDPRPRRHARAGGVGPGPRRAGGEAPVGGRGARHRLLLGRRAGARPGHPRAAGPLQRIGCRSGADGRADRRLQGGRALALHPLQPVARGPAARHLRGRRAAAPRHPRHGARRRRRTRGVTMEPAGATGAG